MVRIGETDTPRWAPQGFVRSREKRDRHILAATISFGLHNRDAAAYKAAMKEHLWPQWLNSLAIALLASVCTAAEPAKTETAAGGQKATNDGWVSLFDGKTLAGWQEADFAGKGPVIVTNGEIVLRSGYMTGIVRTNTRALPTMNYELALEARRIDGNDFFCGLTFPVATNPCSLVVGGWGGSLVGLSSLDGEDAANNETSRTMEFKNGQWYRIRVKVTPGRIQAWIDDERMVDVDVSERRVSVRMEMEPCVPLGVATWSTSGGLRNIRIRSLPGQGP